MKYIVITFILIGVLFSCAKDDSSPDLEEQISFTGVWKRQFEAGLGNLHDVSYKIYQDSIRYKISGSIGNADYVILKKEFTARNDRFIGFNPDNKFHYVLFFKEISDKNITIYKKEVFSFEKAQLVKFPASDNTENHGWNTFGK
ncbi:MAG: hypothetical protein V3U92_00245 [Cellulophaga sp.]